MNNNNTNSVVPNDSTTPETVQEFIARITNELEDALTYDIRSSYNEIKVEPNDDNPEYTIIVRQCSCGEITMNVNEYSDGWGTGKEYYYHDTVYKTSLELIKTFQGDLDCFSDDKPDEDLYKMISEQYEKGLPPNGDWTEDEDYWSDFLSDCGIYYLSIDWFLDRYFKPTLNKWIEDHPNWEKEIKVNV